MLKLQSLIKFPARLVACMLVWAMLVPGIASAGMDDTVQAWSDYRDGQYAKAFSVLNERAENGDPEAQFYLGTVYADGLAVQRNDHKALELYLAAAKQGNPDARFIVGFLLVNGSGTGEQAIAPDPVAGAYWLQKAAEDGNAVAHALLGRLYMQGRGVEQDRSAALRHALVGAKAGITSAQYDAGWLLVGIDSTESLLDAFMYFTLAERAGYPGASENRIVVGGLLTEDERNRATIAADNFLK